MNLYNFPILTGHIEEEPDNGIGNGDEADFIHFIGKFHRFQVNLQKAEKFCDQIPGASAAHPI